MGKPTNILVAIPQPCNEKWDKMTPTDKGRFCNQCSKDVIDFTTWSDARLYAFFSKPKEHVCGWFYDDQLERAILPPAPPPGRLYRLAAALSLTLIFTTGEGKAFARQPIVFESLAGRLLENKDTATTENTVIAGIVRDEQNQPIANATVWLVHKTMIVQSMQTTAEGKYSFANAGSDTYRIMIKAHGFENAEQDSVKAPSSQAFVLKKSTAHITRRQRGGIAIQSPANSFEEETPKPEKAKKGSQKKKPLHPAK